MNLWLLLTLCLHHGLLSEAAENVPKIAIIGGGIGGTGAAYFLRELFGVKGIKIDLYEPIAIGGRLSTATINMNGLAYEMGGSVIHPKNHYAVELMKHLDLERRKLHDTTFGFFDGEKFLFRETNTWNVVNSLKLLWRYGVSLVKMQDYVNDMLAKFERIYDLQLSGFSYPSVNDLLRGMDSSLPETLHISLKDSLKNDGFPQHLIEELISAAIACNYGQTTDVHKFVGYVSLAGAGAGLFSIKGGNYRLPEKLLLASGASLKKTFVTGVELLDKGRYLLHSEKNETVEYDAIIMAIPYAKNVNSNFTFKNFPDTFVLEPTGNYHRTISTVVKGELNHTFFGFKREDDVVDDILCVRTDLPFNSVGRIYPVNDNTSEKSDVWKIFSQAPLTTELLENLFTSVQEVIVKVWLAYPHYQEDKRHDKFRIYDNLYHINAIEWAASAMEMSLVGAKNVALSFYHDWGDHIEISPKRHIKEDL